MFSSPDVVGACLAGVCMCSVWCTDCVKFDVLSVFSMMNSLCSVWCTARNQHDVLPCSTWCICRVQHDVLPVFSMMYSPCSVWYTARVHYNVLNYPCSVWCTARVQFPRCCGCLHSWSLRMQRTRPPSSASWRLTRPHSTTGRRDEGTNSTHAASTLLKIIELSSLLHIWML